jgi:MFS transporter, UMF1 family
LHTPLKNKKANAARSALAADVKLREVWAWAMYDFANSGYTTVVITAIFNAYFVAVVAGNETWATFAWTSALAVSYGLIMITSPILGAYADIYAAKKKLLLFTTIGCVVFTALLALVQPGAIALAVILIVLSNYFFGSGENLIAAFLPELAKGEDVGKVSGWGWSLGYFGGLVSLGACLAYVTWAQARGQEAAQYIPITMLITALLFALASLPTFFILRERAQPQTRISGHNVIYNSWVRLRQTLSHARRYQDLWRFLGCIICFQAGVAAVITLAAVYANQAMHFTTKETLLLVFVVNITAAVGAFAFGYIQDHLGHIRTVALTLVGWIGMVLLAWSSNSATQFWIAANIAGLCMGASQSASRALVGYLSPTTRRAEFYGLWGLAVKLSSILGPMTYGLVSWVTAGNHRLAILITGGYFVLGLITLIGIDVRRGRVAAINNPA